MWSTSVNGRIIKQIQDDGDKAKIKEVTLYAILWQWNKYKFRATERAAAEAVPPFCLQWPPQTFCRANRPCGLRFFAIQLMPWTGLDIHH